MLVFLQLLGQIWETECRKTKQYQQLRKKLVLRNLEGQVTVLSANLDEIRLVLTLLLYMHNGLHQKDQRNSS